MENAIALWVILWLAITLAMAREQRRRLWLWGLLGLVFGFFAATALFFLPKVGPDEIKA